VGAGELPHPGASLGAEGLRDGKYINTEVLTSWCLVCSAGGGAGTHLQGRESQESNELL